MESANWTRPSDAPCPLPSPSWLPFLQLLLPSPALPCSLPQPPSPAGGSWSTAPHQRCLHMDVRHLGGQWPRCDVDRKSVTEESQGVVTKSVDDRLEERERGPRSREAQPGGRGPRGGPGGVGGRGGHGLEGTRSKGCGDSPGSIRQEVRWEVAAGSLWHPGQTWEGRGVQTGRVWAAMTAPLGWASRGASRTSPRPWLSCPRETQFRLPSGCPCVPCHQDCDPTGPGLI